MLRSPQVTLYTRDLPRALAFYEGLGFREAFRYSPGGTPQHVELLLDGFILGIATVETAVADHGLDPVPGGRGMELVFWVDDADEAVARALGLGASLVSAAHDWLDGRLRIAWVADPDGNPIQLAQQRT